MAKPPHPSTPSSATLDPEQTAKDVRAGRLPASALEKRAGSGPRLADRLPVKLPPGKAGRELAEQIAEERRSKRWGSKHFPASPTRDALIALQYTRLADAMPLVVARIQKALDNENDPLHLMVMEKMISRIMPQAFWDRLGTQEFEEESKGGVTVVVNVRAAEAPTETVVVDHTDGGGDV